MVARNRNDPIVEFNSDKMIRQSSDIKTKAPKLISLLSLLFMMAGTFSASAQQENLAESRPMIRIAELEIDTAYLEAYKAILTEEAAASVKLEPGVIAIFPMYPTENPAMVRILEIYASQEAYEQHLKTPHFQKYKTTTLDMVKSLKLVAMEAIDEASMPMMFKKLEENQ